MKYEAEKLYFLYKTVPYLYEACKFYQNYLSKIILHTNKYHNNALIKKKLKNAGAYST